MKLNKMELQALADRIATELQQQAQVEQKTLNETADTANLPQAKKILAEIKRISPTAKQYLIRHRSSVFDNIDLESILKFLRPVQTKISVPGRYDETIFNRLVIAQIECQDIETLIDRIKSQFIQP